MSGVPGQGKGKPKSEEHKEAIRRAMLENGAIVTAVRAGTIQLQLSESVEEQEEGTCVECSD